MNFQILFVLLCLISSVSAYSQIDSQSIIFNIVNGLENALVKNESIQYRTEMKFKEFGVDTLEVRNFHINYKININNELYGYDYEISEVLSDGYELSFMALDKSFYIIDESAPAIIERELPNKIDPGSYFEALKTSFIIADIFQPFIAGSSSNISLIDSSNTYFLEIKISELATAQIIVDKSTFLPLKSVDIIQDENFDLIQIMEVNYIYDYKYNTLSDSAFNPNYYISKGYKYEYKEPNSTAIQSVPKIIFSDQKNILLHYPLININGDTTSISNISSKYILLYFWYASCLPCLKSLPLIDSVGIQYTNLDLKIIGINCFDINIKENLAKKFKNKIYNIEFLYGSKDLIISLKVSSFPSYFIIMPDRSINYIDGGVQDVIKILESLINK